MIEDKILVLSTGGTIASQITPAGLTPTGTLESGPAIGDAQVVVEQPFSLPSAAIGLPEIAKLSRRIDRAPAEGFTGVVVTHGTDTLAETAFTLAVLDRPHPVPVAVTGAMRAPGQVGSDATRNLLDAITVVRSRIDAGAPVVVVFDGTVLPGLTAEKASTTSLAAFTAPQGITLAEVTEGRVHIKGRCAHPQPRIPADPASAGAVAVLCAMPGDDGTVLRACAETVEGVVLGGLGGGHVAPQQMTTLRDLAHTKPVLVTTGTVAGGALTATYTGPGSEQALDESGVIIGWSWGPRKAALAMALCLSRTTDPAEIRFLMKDNLKGARRDDDR